MNIFGHEIKAIIFDYDGTLLDNGDMWHEIDIAFFAHHGMAYPSTYLEDIANTNLAGGAKITKEKYGVPGTEEEFIEEWMSMASDAYAHTLQLKEGAIDTITFFKQAGLKIALATAGDPALFEPSLERLGLNPYFNLKINIAEVGKSKEHPDIYLEAARRLGSKPEETIVFEDMPAGLRSAKNAGFITYAIMDESSQKLEQEKRKYAYGCINNWLTFLGQISKDQSK